MAETFPSSKPPITPTKPLTNVSTSKSYIFDLSKWTAKKAELDIQVKELAGKPKTNPYLKMKDKVWPLQVRFNNGERSPELFNALMAVTIK
jgi:hypothetical protein